MTHGSLSEQVAALRQRFLDQLPERLTRIQGAIAAHDAADDPATAGAARRDARTIAHSLAGAGGTFGFPDISDAALELEAGLQDDASCDTGSEPLADRLRTLERAVARALGKAPPEPAPRRGAAIERRHTAKDFTPHAPRQRRIVYLVEDDVDLADSIALQLGHFGYDVRTFDSPAAIAEAAAAPAPEAILMDIGFPEGELAGPEYLRQTDAPELHQAPVLFISARHDFEARLEAVRAGGKAYFRKPVEISALAAALDRLTHRNPTVPFRVLIIEDDETLADLYSQTLRAVGMEAEYLTTPADISTPLREFAPDLILMDLYMPGCDGIELASVIRQQPAYVSIPIVFLSTETHREKRLSALEHGADDFLTKPIQPDQLVSVVTSRAQRGRELRGHMNYDGMTGLLNHTRLKERLDVELTRGERLGRPVAFAMIDLDHFKQVNDTYGHATGDNVLRSLGRLLPQRLRRTDVAGRYGGEEFAVILTDSDAAHAQKTLESLRNDFAQLAHVGNNAKFHVTLSCGVADSRAFPTAEALCQAADAALYAAKRNGRNRIEINTGDADSPRAPLADGSSPEQQ